MIRWTFAGALFLVGWMLAGVNEPARNARAETESAHFVGETRCGAPTCHGAGLPSNEAAKRDWRPWKSARTQWNTSNIDHHSRAYRTLESEGGKAIAAYMGIRATESEKCLSCHAPDAPTSAGSAHIRREGVTCEHCHGPAEFWLKPHVERDWKDKRAQYFTRGFYDNNNLVLRARKCASCHVEIDHEIVAGGHPPLQFDLVAYAQIMKHWDDQDELPAGSFSIDPTLWAVGQVTGLRQALAMLSERAGNANYQSIGKVSHFQSANCYQCHHKLVDDALRQASGHYAMVEAVFATLFPDQQGTLTGLWNGVSAGTATGADQARERASSADGWLAPYQERIVSRGVDRDATRKILARITGSGETLKRVERFSFSRSPTGNTVRVGSVSAPWWWTTGAPEQTVLAIESLCEPAFDRKSCMGSGGAIEKDVRQLLNAVDRFDYRPDQFSQTLGGIRAKLFR
jgi:hypothetical protein